MQTGRTAKKGRIVGIVLMAWFASGGLTASSSPEAYEAAVARGTKQIEARKWEKAIASFERADALREDGCDRECLVPWGRALIAMGRSTEAVERFERVMERGELDREVVRRMLLIYDLRNRPPKGIRLLRRFLESEAIDESDRVWAENALGIRFLSAAEDEATALAKAERAFRRANAASDGWAGIPQLNLAETLMRAERAIDALAVLDELVARDDDQFPRLPRLAYSREVVTRARSQGFDVDVKTEVRDKVGRFLPPMDPGTVPPRKIGRLSPDYTEEARLSRVEGIVIVSILVNEFGNVEEVVVRQGLPMGLTESAIAAARTSKWEPATLHGEPVSVWWNLTHNFRLGPQGP